MPALRNVGSVAAGFRNSTMLLETILRAAPLPQASAVKPVLGS